MRRLLLLLLLLLLLRCADDWYPAFDMSTRHRTTTKPA